MTAPPVFARLIQRPYGYLLLSLAVCLFFIFRFPEIRYSGDYGYWVSWSEHLRARGVAEAYVGTYINYPPLAIYVLAALNAFWGVHEAIHLFKLFPLAFDFAGPLLAVWMLGRSLRQSLTWAWPTFSAAYLLNSVVWGQVDSVYAGFGFAALAFALKNRAGASVVALALALMVKVQAVVYIPLVGLLLVPSLTSGGRTFRLLGLWLGTMALVCLPYVLKTNGLAELWGNVIHVTMNLFFPALSMNAHNAWQLLFGTQALTTADDLRWLGISCKTWGFAAFVGLSGLALTPLLLYAIDRIRRGLPGYRPPIREAVTPVALLVGGLLPLLFFYCNTQMHERYSHPAMLFLFAFGLATGQFRYYWIVSVAYFLNITHLLGRSTAAQWPPDGLLFQAYELLPRGVALTYGVLLILLFRELFLRTRADLHRRQSLRRSASAA